MSDKQYYEQSAMWQDYDRGNSISGKTKLIRKIIPSDVKNILDVGCGNGMITNALAGKYDITGVDFSQAALQHVKAKTILSSCVSIPVENTSFDLVLSSELLEHLNDADLESTVHELDRISRKYILLSVPNREYLDKNFILCPKCRQSFHSWHHVQSFSRGRILRMFPGYKLLYYVCTGHSEQRWIPLLLKLRQQIGKQWFAAGDQTVCPNCGNTRFTYHSSNWLTKLCNGVNKAIAGRKRYWMIFLLEKGKF